MGGARLRSMIGAPVATIKRLIVSPFKRSILDVALIIIDNFGNISLQGDSDCQRRRQGGKLYFRDVFHI